MIIRKIKPEEVKRTVELFSIAFEYAIDVKKSAQEVYEEVSTNPTSREDAFWSERWAAFEDDDKTMMSYFIAKPFPVHFDGQIYTMTGIGGVATLPQYRRNGGIRKCFEAALPAMYHDNVTFSYLYPFSTAYYRKFGYEIGCEKWQYHISLSHVKPFPVSGKCYLLEPENRMLEDIKEIYRNWQNKYNMMIVNEDYEYAWVRDANPTKNQEFTYVYKSERGTPLGYMSFKQVTEPDGRNISCNRLCFTCAEGLKGLLNILISLSSDHGYATLEVPIDTDLTLLFPEWSMGAISLKKIPAGMVRVINVEKVLANAAYRGNGCITLTVSDAQITENNGTFQVSFENGTCTQITRVNSALADVTMGINEFSRLIIGACDVESFNYMDNVTIRHASAPLQQMFYKKPTMIAEYF